MKFSTLLIALASVGAVTANSSLPDKLQVGVKYRPDKCDDRSHAGDLLAM